LNETIAAQFRAAQPKIKYLCENKKQYVWAMSPEELPSDLIH